jgi:hypothetical protein
MAEGADRPLRPDMLQTYIPFVEMYINGVDILRTKDGKPRSLISFTHDVVAGSGGMWTLHVFDPDFVAIEEVLFATSLVAESTEVALETFGKLVDDKNKEEVLNGAIFRYGYMNKESKILSVSPSGEEFYYGTVHAYVPDYQPHGTYLTIRGDSIGGGIFRKKVLHQTVYSGLGFMDIILKICKQNGWTFVPLGGIEGENLPEEKQPTKLYHTESAFISTEEGGLQLKLREGETPLNFLNRLWADLRPEARYYGSYTFYLEFRGKAKTTETGQTVLEEGKGYLYFGPEDVVKQGPIRKYVYLRDPETDVLTFTPSIDAYVLIKSGGAGMTWKVDNAATGEMVSHFTSETSRTQKHFRHRRPPVTINLKELGVLQEGEPEFDDGDENLAEGGKEGPFDLAPLKQPDPDGNVVELSLATIEKARADYQFLNYWLTMKTFINTATLEIFGDPSQDMQPGRMIAVLLYVPGKDGKLTEIHWISSFWTITSLQHTIQGGSYITTLGLARSSFAGGTVQSKAMYNMAFEDLGGTV